MKSIDRKKSLWWLSCKSWWVRVFSTTVILSMVLISLANSQASADTAPWPMFMHDPQRSGTSPYLGPQSSDVAWIFSGIPTHYGWGATQPAVSSDGTIYVYSDSDNYLYAVASDGNLKWKVRTADEGTGGGSAFPPAIGSDGTVYIPAPRLDSGYKLLALDPTTGLTKWSYLLGRLSSTPAIGSDGAIYIGSESLYAINPDGTLKWRYDGVYTGGPFSITIGPDGTIYVPESAGLAAVNSDSSLKWRISTGWISGSPAIGPDSTIYLPVGSELWAIFPDDGAQKWVFRNPYCWTNDWRGITPIAVAPDGTVYSGMCSFLYAVYPSGELKWYFNTYPNGFGYYNTPTIDSAGSIFIGGGVTVYALNQDRTLKWNYTDVQSAGFLWSSIGSNGSLYVISGIGELYAFGLGMPPAFESPPTPAPGSTLVVNAGDTLTFTVEASDPDPGQTVTLNVEGLPEGATMTPGLPTIGNPASSAFSWTPVEAQVGTFILTFAATDNTGQQTPYSLTIEVLSKPSPYKCPLGQGFWKTHPNAWPVTSLILGDETYSKSELFAILKTPIGQKGGADASLILAHQLIATKLNIANGSDPAPISSTIANADSLLSSFAEKLPYYVKPSSATGQAMVNDANVLDSYNSGQLTQNCIP